MSGLKWEVSSCKFEVATGRVWPAYGGGFHLHRFGSISGNWLCFPKRGIEAMPHDSLWPIGFVSHIRPSRCRPGFLKLALFRTSNFTLQTSNFFSIGFVLLRPIGCTIHHNSFLAEHLPLLFPLPKLGLFGAIDRSRRPARRTPPRRPASGSWVRLAHSVPRQPVRRQGGRPAGGIQPSILNPQSCHPGCDRGPQSSNWLRLAHFAPQIGFVFAAVYRLRTTAHCLLASFCRIAHPGEPEAPARPPAAAKMLFNHELH